MKKTILLLISVLLPLVTQAENLTIERLQSGEFYAQRIHGVRAMADGVSYARISDDYKRIVRYDFKTGKELGVIFDVENARDVKLKSFQGYIMSPDESKILIQTETKSIYRHSFTAQYYIYDVKSRHMTRLSDGGAQQVPIWSHDGNMIAFVRDNNIFLVKLLFGNAESQVTKDGKFNEVLNGIPDWVNEEEFANDRCLDFTADDLMLVWVRADESKVPTFSFPLYKGLSPANEKYEVYPGEYKYKYPVAGEQNSTVTVMSYDIKAHQTRTMKLPLDADGYIPRIFATSDADKVAVVTLNRHQDRMDIYMANPRSTECKLALRDEVKCYIAEQAYCQMKFVKDGFYLLSERNGYNHIYQYNLNGELKREVTKGNIVVTEFYGIDDKTGDIYYSARDNDPTRVYIYKVDVKGKVTCLTHEKGEHEAIFSSSMKYFMHVYSNIDTPYITTLCDNNGKTLTTLVDNASLKELLAAEQLGKREVFTFTTAEGVELYGYMVKPANFDPNKKYPVVMFQYSGPGSQQVHDAWSAGSLGQGTMYEHYLCEQGFICVCVDGRGTGGRGADFERCTYLNLGDLESKDQVETAIWLGQQSFVDKEAIGIWGWSFGGFNTLMSLSEGRPVFACGVAVAPPTNWRYYDTVYTERFMRTPKENAEGYARNPMQRARQLHGALLICHGTADDNVHLRNVAEYTESLVQADKDFRELIYTNRNHNIFGGNTRRHLMRSITQHFITNLMKK